jgi:hypothetical protein
MTELRAAHPCPARAGETRPARYGGSRMSDGLEQRHRRVLRLRTAAAAIAAAGTLVLAGGCSSAADSSPAGKSAGPVTSAAADASCRRLTAAACYAPQQFRVAYGIQPLLDRGIDGRGQTVVLMEFARKPDRSLTSARTWRCLTPCSVCPPRGCRLTPASRARPRRRQQPARRWRTPRSCTRSPLTPSSA